MRKWILAGIMILALANPVFAGQQRRTIVDAEVLTATNTRTTGTMNVVGAKKVSFFTTYDSSLETTGVTVTVTFSYTVDGTNWADANFFDVSGGATAQTTESLDTDTVYYTWLDEAQAAREVRVWIGLGDTSIAEIEVDDTGITGTVTVVGITQD